MTTTQVQEIQQEQPQPQTKKTPIPDYNKQEKGNDKNCLLVIKRRHNSNPEVIKEAINYHTGVKLANLCYKYFFLHSAAVIEVDVLGETAEDRFNVAYKIENTCKHYSIQMVRLLELFDNAEVPFCEDCKTTVPNNSKLVIDETTISAREEVMKDRLGNVKDIIV